jgi:hypothetical protein
MTLAGNFARWLTSNRRNVAIEMLGASRCNTPFIETAPE